MSRLQSLSIRAQMFLMVLVIALSAVGIIVYSGLKLRQNAIDEAVQEIDRLGDRIVALHEQSVASSEQLMNTLAQLREVRSRDNAATTVILRQLLPLNPLFMNLAVADRDGAIWASAVSNKATRVADRRYFQNARATGRMSSGEFAISRITGRPTVCFGFPYRGSDGAFAGTIITAFDLEQLCHELGLPPSLQYSYQLFDHRGVLLETSDANRRLIGSLDRPDLFQAMQAPRRQGSFVAAGPDGTRRFMTFHTLRLKGEQFPFLYVRTSVPMGQVVAQANSQLLYNLLIFALLLGVAMLGAWLLAKTFIIDRLVVLQAASRRLARGERQVRISDCVSGGELGELGRCFDEMAQQLDARERERDRAETALRRSEGRYRSLFENSLFGMVSTGADCRLLQVNKRFCTLLGYREEELLGRPFAEITHPDDLPANLELHQAMMRGETSGYTIEKRYLCKSGAWARVLCFTEGNYNDEGGFEGNIACILDISALRASEERMRLYFERQVVGMAITSPQMRWLQTNAALQQMFGYSDQELGELSWQELTHPEDLELGLVQWRRLLDGQQDEFSCEIRMLRRDGSTLNSNVSMVCVRREDGQVDYVLALYDDITERKRAEEELLKLQSTLEQRVQERTAQLEAAIREQESFSYSVSHDLRSPLRHINSYLSILQEEFGRELPFDARYYLERAAAASVRMGQLIDDLLELSRVSRSKLVREEVDLSALAFSILSRLQETEPERHVEVAIEPDLVTRGDKVLMGLVLENLLGNAWKYSSRKATAQVQLGAAAVDGGRAFFVRDNGAGFDMKYQDKLFGAFQRLHGDEYEGTGIGLATVKRILERHGGQVWAEGKPGAGATFYFSLP